MGEEQQRFSTRHGRGTAGRVAERMAMVQRQIAARGVTSEPVLRAMEEVPRENFVAPEAVDLAYRDSALPIAEGQTISQPFVVALMAEAAEIEPDDRVLEVGTGSGYGAAVLGRLAAQVFTIERHVGLADAARRSLEQLGYDNVEVRTGDGTVGWPEEEPFDAIVVTAGSPDPIPPALEEQLAPGGRLIIPAGETKQGQEMLRIRRPDDGGALQRERLGAVSFVPLLGEAGWRLGGPAEDTTRRAPSPSAPAPSAQAPSAPPESSTPAHDVPSRLARAAEPFDDLGTLDLGPLLDRIGGARLVLLGEASHGTSDFYRMRDLITRELIESRGFDFVALEADWPDAAELDAYARHRPAERPRYKPFQRFPRWMWANTEFMELARWLRSYNEPFRETAPGRMAGLHGLDLYSMHASIDAVLAYLDETDPEAASLARTRYECLTPWQDDPVLYGRDVLSGRFDECEDDVLAQLGDLLEQRMEYVRRDGRRFLDAVQNARLVANAEQYYRAMYRGSVASWNLRDRHMFETLGLLLAHYGPESRGVVWAHNSHLGDASATAMADRGEQNLGQLAREAFGRGAYLIGFGTHTGTVAAASSWGGPMEVKEVRPSHPRSYENLAHRSEVDRFFLPLRDPADPELARELAERRLERAIGVIYRPETELQSHYFPASLPRQFDEWIWLDETRAVTPIGSEERAAAEARGEPDTFPFGV